MTPPISAPQGHQLVGFLAEAARADGWADAAIAAEHRTDHDHAAHDHAIPVPADGVVARVAGAPITIEDLDRRLDAVYSGPMRSVLPGREGPEGRRLRRWVLQLLITERLVVGECDRLGLPLPEPEEVAGPVAPNGADPATEQAVTAAVSALFAHVTKRIEIPEEELLRYYEANPDRWRIPERRTVRQACFPAQEQAAACGAGDLGEPYDLLRGELAGNVEAAVFAAEPGSRVGPVRSPLGWHVMLVDGETRPTAVRPFAEVREAIEADLLAAARGTAFDDRLAAWRAELTWIAPGYEHPGDPAAPDFVHRH